MCIAGQCERMGTVPEPDSTIVLIDAPPVPDAVDGMITPTDRDGDGIPDTSDNCPDVANPDQGDEDGDKIGDACDPCPISSATADSDGDGVPDACDPNPTVAGDSLSMFEGFHNGLPAGWQILGTVSAAGDDLQIEAAATEDGGLMPAITPPANGMIAMHVIVDQMHGTHDSGIGATINFDPTAIQGVTCELYAPLATTPAMNYVSLYDYTTQTELAHGSLTWQTGVEYTLSFVKRGTGYTCTVTPPTGAPLVSGGTSSSAPATPHAMIESFSSKTRVAWMMVVASAGP